MPTREIKGDIFPKKFWGAALNISLGIPIIPMVSYGIGKIFQQTHEELGLGSTLARTFLGIAKLGLENSAFSLKKEDGKASWPVGTSLNGVKKSINNIDIRERELGRNGYIRNFFSGCAAFIGFFPNIVSVIPNFFGDCSYYLADMARASGKEAGIITKSFFYALAGALSLIGFACRAPAVLLRSAGSILSADAEFLPEGSRRGRWLASRGNFFDSCRFEEKVSNIRNINEHLLTLPDLGDDSNNAVRKKAIELFKKIKGPKFKKSGITGDDFLYCAVAKIKFEGESYELLLSPESGSFLIANPKRDLNASKDAERDNLNSISQDKRQSFLNLIENLKVADTFHKSGENLITMTEDNPGLSYEEFTKSKSSLVREKEEDAIKFQLKSIEYEFSKTIGEQKRTLKDLSRPDAPRLVGTLEEFMILNRLAKNHIKEIPPQQKSESRFPGAAVKSPTAVRLMKLQSEREVSFFSR